MQLFNYFFLLLSFSFVVQAALYDPNEIMKPGYNLTITSTSSESDVELFIIRRQLLTWPNPMEILPKILKDLKNRCANGSQDRADYLIIFDGVLRHFKDFISVDDHWFGDLMAQLMETQNLEAIKIVLDLFHNIDFLYQCLGMNLTENQEIYALLNGFMTREVERADVEAVIQAAVENADVGETRAAIEQERVEAAAPVPAVAGPLMNIFNLSAGGVFDQQAGRVHSDPVTGYFHIGNRTHIVMGMVLPALDAAQLNDHLLNGTLDQFIAGHFSAESKGMVLWYDRPSNRATLRRIKNTVDATAPVLAVYRPDDVEIFSLIDESREVVASTRTDMKNAGIASFEMTPGLLIVGFPAAAYNQYEQYELDSSLSEFDMDEKDDLATVMEEGLENLRNYIPNGPLYAARLIKSEEKEDNEKAEDAVVEAPQMHFLDTFEFHHGELKELNGFYRQFETGYFQIASENHMIIGMVEPCFFSDDLRDAPLSSIESFMGYMSQRPLHYERKGMVLWHDRRTNRAVLHRYNFAYKNSPVLRIYHPTSNSNFPYQPLQAASEVANMQRIRAEFEMTLDLLIIGLPWKIVEHLLNNELDGYVSCFDVQGVVEDVRILPLMNRAFLNSSFYAARAHLG